MAREMTSSQQALSFGGKRQAVGPLKRFQDNPDKCRGITTAMLAVRWRFFLQATFQKCISGAGTPHFPWYIAEARRDGILLSDQAGIMTIRSADLLQQIKPIYWQQRLKNRCMASICLHIVIITRS